MSTITSVSNQWMTRPDDERFVSIPALAAFKRHQREISREVVVSSRKINIAPADADPRRGLVVTGPNGHAYTPTHHSFGQLANLGGAPAGYLRSLPAPLAADCINFGLHVSREVEDVGCLLQRNGDGEAIFRAATGPKYGRVWDVEPVEMLMDRFGDGVTGHWRVPGPFKSQLSEVTKENTTIFASDRDMFVFLADQERRIEISDRRDGQPGSFARGFFVWNSEVGSRTLGAAFFLFDYMCCNRIIWGVGQYQEVRIRHTSGAPDRWLDSVVPVLEDYSASSAKPVIETIEAARARKIDEDLDKFLATRFGKAMAPKIEAAHVADEGRPIETIWDAVTGATAYARTVPHQDLRIEIEAKAGELLKVAVR